MMATSLLKTSTARRWLKFVNDAGYLAYEYTSRPMDADDRDGSDVRRHYHASAVDGAEAAVEADARDASRYLPPLSRRDASYSEAMASFYDE